MWGRRLACGRRATIKAGTKPDEAMRPGVRYGTKAGIRSVEKKFSDQRRNGTYRRANQVRPRGHGTETGFVRAAGAGTRRSAEKVLRRAQGQAASVTASDQSSRAYAPHSLYSPGRGLSLGVSQSATQSPPHMRRGEACTNTLASVAIMLVVMRTVLPLYYALMLHSCKLAHSLTQRLKAHNDVATAALQRLQLHISISVCIQTRNKLAHSHAQQLEAHNDARWLYTQLSRGF